MNFARLITFGGAILSAVVFVAGCGNGGGASTDSTVTAASISKAQFVKQANSLCNGSGEEMLLGITRYEEEHRGTPPDELAKGAIRNGAGPVLQALADEIRGLGAPAGDEPEVEAYLAALQHSIRVIGEGKGTTLTDLQADVAPVGAPARAYGLIECEY